MCQVRESIGSKQEEIVWSAVQEGTLRTGSPYPEELKQDLLGFSRQTQQN